MYKQHFYKQRQAEIDKKNQANAKQHPEAELLLFENYSYSSSTALFKNNYVSKNKQQKKLCLYSLDYTINHNENEKKNEN